MATIVLRRREVEEQDLPFICLRCGRPATLWKTKHFILASPSPAANLGKLNHIEVPLCPAHKTHWFWRGIIGGGLGAILIACLLAGLAAVAEPGQISPALQGPLMAAFGVGFFGLILWLPLVLVLHFTSMRPTSVTDNDIALTGVSQAFVDELAERRHERSGGPKGDRRGGRRRRRGPDE